jgi:hypothetical protein
MTTKAMLDALKGGNTCFKSVPAGKQPNLRPGDLVVYKHSSGGIGHVFLVDRLNKNSCDDMSIIQAAGSKAGVGITSISGGAKSDDQGRAESMLKSVNCGQGSTTTSDGNVEIVRFDSSIPGCVGTPKRLENEGCVNKCDVGRMIDHG